MDYQLALSPDVGLSAADFVSAWNEDSELRTVAEAQVSSSSSAHFDPLLLGMIAVLSNVGLGVATNALYDLIKKVLTKKGIHKRTQIVKVDQPDGTHLLVVTIDE